jgi:aspartate 1-decarboxylase
MYINMLKGKLHRVMVTKSDLNYPGSIGIDQELLDVSGIREFEAVNVWNINNGARLTTYAISSPRGSGEICLNGAAARYAQVGDIIIVAAFCMMTEEEAEQHTPRVVTVGERNEIATLV